MLIQHSLQFVTEIDDSHPNAIMLQNMPEEYVKAIFEKMLQELVAPRIQPILEELNENGTFAFLRLAE